MGYRETLRRGYAVVRDSNDGVVTSAAEASRMYEVEFADGRVALDGNVSRAVAAPMAKKEPPKSKSKPTKKSNTDQGSLF
jgi:exodeoxyribonuclease VII large subunit